MRLVDVGRNYDWLAPRYDRWTDLVFGRLLGVEEYRTRTIDLLGPLGGATVLDIGCGTGRNFPILVPRLGDGGRVIGLDYSQGMLDQARKRVAARGWNNVALVRGDAAQLEGVPESIDAAVSIWCLGIVHDLEAALNRAIDTLRPGGRIAIMDFQRSRPARGLLRWLYPLYSFALQRAGIDSAEDLDNAQLREKWERGRRLLQARLRDLEEVTYLQGAGLILAGGKPHAATDR
jgi:ubiquinone/menaquinone biosynthesis C-methylase UbiE